MKGGKTNEEKIVINDSNNFNITNNIANANCNMGKQINTEISSTGKIQQKYNSKMKINSL